MNWYVLYVQALKVDKLLIYLNRVKGIDAFTPLLEYYRDVSKSIDVKPLFRGYIFVKTKMNQLEFNNVINNIEDKDGLIKQLWFKDEETTALTKEEIDMFEHILDGSYVVRMSQAFLQDGKAKIISGPLKYFENNIIKVDRHEKLAYLDIDFMNKRMKAGLLITK